MSLWRCLITIYRNSLLLKVSALHARHWLLIVFKATLFFLIKCLVVSSLLFKILVESLLEHCHPPITFLGKKQHIWTLWVTPWKMLLWILHVGKLQVSLLLKMARLWNLIFILSAHFEPIYLHSMLQLAQKEVVEKCLMGVIKLCNVQLGLTFLCHEMMVRLGK